MFDHLLTRPGSGFLPATCFEATLQIPRCDEHVVVGRVVLLLGVAFSLLSGEIANADPVEDFLKKLGRSISKAFHPQPTHRTSTKSTTKRSSPQELNSVEASPSPRVEPLKSEAEATPSPAVRRASAASRAKGKKDMPFGIPVPGKKGFVTSPYLPDGDYVDVSAFAPG